MKMILLDIRMILIVNKIYYILMQVTIFSCLYDCDNFINNYINCLNNLNNFDKNYLIITNVVDSNNSETNKKINILSELNNVTLIEIKKKKILDYMNVGII